MVIHKVTPGYVVQRFDSFGVCIGQEFIAGDDVSYENDVGDKVEIPKIDTYVPFRMVKQHNFTDVELVNDCFNKLIAQGGCSVKYNGECLYRGMCGRKCAIGLYIPDEDYDAAFEGGSAHEYSESADNMRICNILRSVGIRPKKMLVLQRCHDESARATNQIEQLEKYRQKLLQILEHGKTLEDMQYALDIA